MARTGPPHLVHSDDVVLPARNLRRLVASPSERLYLRGRAQSEVDFQPAPVRGRDDVGSDVARVPVRSGELRPSFSRPWALC
jgi:hypothetical protein